MELTPPSTEGGWRSYATICRLCLQKDGFMLGIFNHIQGRDRSIYRKIVDCTALQIAFGDGLPNVICHRCLYKIEFCLDFRKLCFMSDATLRQLNSAISDNGQRPIAVENQTQFFEHLAGGQEKGEDVVMVVDPTALDYESDYDDTNTNDMHFHGGTASNAISDNEGNDQDSSMLNDFGGKNVFMCKYCDHAFTDRNECMEHELAAHNSDEPCACGLCDGRFPDRMQYSAHLKTDHQNDKPYQCPQCDRTFARRSDLRKHTVVHTGIKPYTCIVCLKSFSRNTNLSKHMRIHSGQKPFVCQKCPKTFFSKGDLTRHAIVHSGQKPFQCSYCELSFGRKDKLLRHEKRHYSQRDNSSTDKSRHGYANRYVNGNDVDEPLVRPQSSASTDTVHAGGGDGQQFHSSNSEKMVISVDPFGHGNETGGVGGSHMFLNHHNSEPEAKIKNEDENSFIEGFRSSAPTSSAVSLNHDDDGLESDDQMSDLSQIPAHITGDSSFTVDDHQGVTDGISVRRFACTVCPKTFSNPENMRYHQATHSGLRPHVCVICGKSFIRKRELDRHFATHTGMKPFKCTKCSKSFGRKDKLVRHLRIHDVQKTHFCRICFSTFNRKDGLLQHMKQHEPHPPIKPEYEPELS